MTSEHGDVLTVSYYKNPNSANRLIKEDFQYTGSTSITYNITTSKYEIDLAYTRIANSDAIVYWNGILLSENIDYSISLFDSSKVVLNFAITDPTSLSVVYFSSYGGGGTINATGPSYQINWSIQNQIPNNVIGNFTHEFYTALTSTSVYSVDTPYDYTTINYSQVFNWQSIYPTLIYGGSYFYRIASNLYYL